MNKLLKKIIAVAIILLIIAYNSISMAASITSLQNEKEDLQDEKDGVKDKISETKKELDEITHEKSETLEQVEKLINQISSYNSEIEELNEKIKKLGDKIKESEKQIKEDEAEQKKQEKALDDRLVAMYQSGETSYLDFLLSSASLVDFISSYYLVSEVTEYDTKMLEQLEAHRKKIEKEKKELEEDRKSLSSSKTTLESKQSALKIAKKTKQEYASQLSEKEKEAESKLQELQDTNDELDRQIRAAQAAIEAAKKAAAANASSNGNTNYSSSTASPNSAGFIWPTLSKYSVTTGMYYSSGKYHGAIDISGGGISGTPVYAVADGYVVTSIAKMSNGKYVSYGNYVLIAHYNGLYTLYAHMNSRNVSTGQTVKQGQVIGTVGSTGNSTGPHLHFEVRTNGYYSSRVNPLNYISK